MNGEISFFVPGIPQPGGSKKGFFNPRLKRVIITEDNAKSKPWRACVAQVASDAINGLMVGGLLEGPLKVRFDFVFPRPKGHFGSGKNANVLKPSAPPYPDVRPDATKLMRSTEDALKGILWRDDCQIVTQVATKRYGEQAGALIRVRQENGQ